jgi:hypothetical protein
MPATTLIAPQPGSRLRGGGNHFGFLMMNRSSAGVFTIPSTGNDSLGDPAGSLHILGYHQESAWARDDKGAWTIDFTLLDMDIQHKNMMEMLAPITAQSILKDPDFTAEDGTLLVNAEISGDVTMPYWLSWYVGAPLAGKAQVRFAIGQFQPVNSVNQKPTEWSLNKIKFRTVDANGYAIASVPGDSAISTISAGPTLAAPNQHGIWVAGT